MATNRFLETYSSIIIIIYISLLDTHIPKIWKRYKNNLARFASTYWCKKKEPAHIHSQIQLCSLHPDQSYWLKNETFAMICILFKKTSICKNEIVVVVAKDWPTWGGTPCQNCGKVSSIPNTVGHAILWCKMVDNVSLIICGPCILLIWQYWLKSLSESWNIKGESFSKATVLNSAESRGLIATYIFKVII